MDTKLENEFPVASVDALGQPVQEVNTKPYTSIIVCIVISVLMIVTPIMGIQKLWILGVIVLVLAIFVQLKIPNEKRIAFYDDCLVIFPHKMKDVCQKVDYDDIVEWVVRQGNVNGDQFILRLQGDRYIQTESFNSIKIVKFLNKKIPEKEANKKQKDEMKNTPLKWPWKKK